MTDPDVYLEHDAVALAPRYSGAEPFPHIVIDDFFPAERLAAVRREISAARIDPEAPGYGWFGKRRASDLERFPEETRRLVEELNSPPFLGWLEQVTGIPDLEPDPYLEGGGIHQTPAGGYLKIHTDFNWHERLQRHRRINLLVYLNENWNEDWGGHLELWAEDQVGNPDGAPAVSIAPHFNRVAIFSTTDRSYHGHPHPLTCPPERTRDSLALYYYTKARPADEVRFGQLNMTNYRPRPDEGFGLKHRIHQWLIRHPALRRIAGRFRT